MDGHRGVEGAGELGMFSNIPEARLQYRLAEYYKSPAPINFSSVKDRPKKCHITNTLKSKDNSESKSD